VLQGPEGLDRLSSKGSLRVAPSELEALGLDQPIAFAVPANTLIVADTLGFHARAVAARPSIRVELWAYTRRNPFLPFTGLNIGNLPFLRHRRIVLLWRLQDRFPGLLHRSVLPTGIRKPGEL
ncbi:MAG TPA: phytanoyl-CoA dioxygenase, partial [Sphingobium sp.]